MDEIEIYYLDDSELAEFEANQKGYRLDVYVKTKEGYFNVNIYDMVRLKQDFDDEVEEEGYYAVSPNLVLVKEVTTYEITFTIKKLYKQLYFNKVKSVDIISISELKRI